MRTEELVALIIILICGMGLYAAAYMVHGKDGEDE